MGPVLALDTSTVLGSIAVGDGQRIMAEAALGVRAQHAESLLPAVQWALGALGLKPEDLGGVVVGAGPGSFTGVRIAGATAKGLVHALDLPFFAYSSLEALAAGQGAGDSPVCALFDARRNTVYSATYRFPGGNAVEPLVEPAHREIGSVLADCAACGMLFAGDGALRHRRLIEAAGGRVAPVHLASPRAAALLWLAGLDPERGRVAEPGGWEPSYLLGSSAERGVAG